MNEETWNELELPAMCQDSIFAQSFLTQIFQHLCKKPDDKLVDQTFFTKHNGNFFMEIILSSKI